MPAHHSIPEDNYTALTGIDLKHDTVWFLSGITNAVVENAQGVRAEAPLIGWTEGGTVHVFLSPDGFPCTLEDWTVKDVRR